MTITDHQKVELAMRRALAAVDLSRRSGASLTKFEYNPA
jgi:hypothetical protein